jgi:SAM-dependent methyltransferase
MAENEWYKDWFNSEYYHKLYFERDEEEAKNFIERLIKHFLPPVQSRMVDVACGKGRHSKFLASKGFKVTGIDISYDSIQYAKQFETDKLNFYVHDMRLLFWVNYFDFAFNFFTSFGYFKTRREHDDAIRTIAASLKPSGILLIDFMNVHYAEEHLVPVETKKVGDTLYQINRWHDESHFYKKVNVTDPKLDKQLQHIEKVAKFSLGDFTDMVSYQKMQIIEVFGDYHLNPYHISKTPRLIVVAKKVSN